MTPILQLLKDKGENLDFLTNNAIIEKIEKKQITPIIDKGNGQIELNMYDKSEANS